ncbi:MAG TPA: chromate transporter [Verrucomicrobiae bacterium]|nr:chromate transporter [Verrucomicrobiae bacterium]
MSVEAAAPPQARVTPPSLLQIAATFAAISSTAFGGGQKASIRQQVVKQGWMDRDEFMDGLALAQVLPGPNILNLAIYCGQKTRGVPGAVAAFLGASVPPFLIILIAGALYTKYASNPWVHGALRGASVGALGLTIGNAFELSWDERDDWIKIVLLALTAVVVGLYKMPLLLVLVIFGGVGIVHEFLKSKRAGKQAAP